MTEASYPPLAPMDPNDPATRDWFRAQQDREIEAIRGVLTAQEQPPATGRQAGPAARMRPGETLEMEPRPGGSGGSAISPAKPLSSFHYYRQRRPEDWNACGQAAIASMLDFYGRDLGLQTDKDGHWEDSKAIDKVIDSGFGPDVVLGWGSTPGRIRDALVHFGVAAETGNSGLLFSGWTTEWNKLLAYVYYSAIPVPVLIDVGVLGGPHFVAHWPIAWKMERSASGMLVHLANWSSEPVPAERFLEAWACRQLPLWHNHAAVYTGRPRVSF